MNSHAHARGQIGDPFSDPARALRLTVAGDVGSASKLDVMLMGRLGRLRGVQVDALPGAGLSGSQDVAFIKVAWGDEYARVETTRDGGSAASTYFDRSWRQALETLGHPPDQTSSLAEAIAAHMALGNDYLICPTLLPERDSSAFWGRSLGTASVAEAGYLAGVKSRTFSANVVNGLSEAHLSINTGWIEDLAARELAPCLTRALAGSLASAAADEKAATSNLLTIRSLLRDLLLARDELTILERREVLGVDWVRRQAREVDVSGGAGNDLTYHVSYHVTAALSAFSGILDNLSWVVAARDRVRDKPRNIGFDRLASPTPPAPWDAIKPRAYLTSAMPWSAVGQALALRVLRNQVMHRSRLTFGYARAVENAQMGSGPECLAVWLWKQEEKTRMPDGHEFAPTAPIEGIALLDLPDCLLVRPRSLVELAIAVSARVTEDILSHYEWTKGSWLRLDPRWNLDRFTQRLSRGRWSRAIWGLGVTSPAARATLSMPFQPPHRSRESGP